MNADDSLDYLTGSDEEAAHLFVEMEKAEEKAKQVKAAMFLLQTGTIPEREAKAVNSPEYDAALVNRWEAARAYKEVLNKRFTAELRVRWEQTVAANRRQGNI